MPRRMTYNSYMVQKARAERQRQQMERAQAREKERAAKEEARRRAQTDKEVKQRYLQIRIEDTDEKNRELADRIDGLGKILEHAADVNSSISFSDLRDHQAFPVFEFPKELLQEPIPPQNNALSMKEPDALAKLIPGWEKRHAKALQEAQRNFEIAKYNYEQQVAQRNEKIKQLEEEYIGRKNEFELAQQKHNSEVDGLETSYTGGDPSAIVAYCTMVLERSEYPDGFPRNYRLAYIPESKQLVIEYQLPSRNIVPAISEFKYVKTKDVVDEKPRKPTEIKTVYQDIVAAICLRTLHEMFEADQGNHLDVVVFNGYVEDVDPATGKEIHPCLISIRTTKESFKEITLSKIDKKACLRNLGAQVSPQPAELQPVKPVIEFDMVDKRFVEESDVLSSLESRPNLMDLNPWEFENLVENLFSKIGFEAKLTRSSKDGGVDVVAFDPRPILGGKVVIQAKRYKNAVGVSAVRDLYGTMINEGAGKGILVTTSHYGPDAYEFAKDKPIELIDGGGLLYLLEQNGIQARIIMPEDDAT